MDDYKIQETIGDGSFGVVYKATHLKTGDTVAMKKIKKKFNSWDECMSLRELKSLRKLTHSNIVKLRECLKVKDELYFVFEFMEQNVYQLYNQKGGKSLPESQIKTIMYHAFSGLAYMHKHGFFHRDLKPENLLVTNGITKIADFGLAREIRSRPPYTDYVATRWYRAPEIMLKQPNYNSPVDIFALGCIMAELYLNEPLFKGSSELEQMYKICSVLGTPTASTWNEGLRLAALIGFTFPQLPPVNLATLIPRASDDAINLLTELLRLDPQKRPSAQQVLQHPYFAGFVPDEKGFATTGVEQSYGLSNTNSVKSFGSEDPFSAPKRDYTSKLNEIEDQDHLEILNELGLETNLGKENVNWDTTVPKKQDKGDWDAKPSEEDNTDHLLAEIEEYIKSETSKKDSVPYNHSRSTSNNTAATNNYDGGFGGAGTQDRAGYRDSVSGIPGMTSGNYRGSISGMPGQMGPSSFDIMGGAGYSYGNNNQYSSNTSGANDNLYKFNTAGSNASNNPQYNNKNTNLPSKGAQIMNTFVSSNSTKALNPGGAFSTSTGENYGRFGY